MSIRACLAVLGLCLPLGNASAQTQASIGNGLTSMVFQINGSDLWLQSISNDSLTRSVSLLPGSGGWSERLVVSSEPSPGAGPTSNDPSQWFEIGPAGLGAWNTSVWSSAPAVVLPNDIVWVVNQAQDELTAVWSGTIDYTAADPAAVLMDYEVVVRWNTPPGVSLPECSLRIDLQPAGVGSDARATPPSRPGRGGSAGAAAGASPLLYSSSVRHPMLLVPSFNDPDEELIVPYVGGMLVRDPTHNPFPASFDNAPNTFPINLSAFYGCEDAPTCAAPPTCFVTWDGDFGGSWKTLGLANGVDGQGTGYVRFSYEYVPEDVFTNHQWDAPSTIVAGVMAGDWWDVAAAHQDALAASGVPWYTAPMSSAANPRSQVVKDVAAEAFLIPGHEGDNMDLISRQMMDMTRVLGPHVNVVMYGGYAPDVFDAWLENGGYLEPGRPSFSGAVSEGQGQFGHVVSPYVNGSELTDYVKAGIPADPDLLAAHDAMLLDEGLAPDYFGTSDMAFMCPGESWWFDWLVQEVSEIVSFTHAKGVYLDYFLTGVCYSPDHGGNGQGPAGHAPGGGDWMLRLRSEQLTNLRAALGDDILIGIEFVMGRWADVVDIMHSDVERTVMPSGNWLCCDNGSCTVYPDLNSCTTACGTPCLTEVHPTAVSIPLFRAVHDDVKLSRIIDAPRVTRSDRRAWIEAVHVFTFGQIPQVTRSEFELWPLFGNRFSFAPYFGYFQQGVGFDATIPFGDGGGGKSLPIAAPAAAMDEARYRRFAARLSASLQGYDQSSLFGLNPGDVAGFEDDFSQTTTAPGSGNKQGAFLEGLRAWHEGSMRRLPDYWVAEVGGAGVVGDSRTIPSMEPDLADGVFTTTPTYNEVGFLDPQNLPVGDPDFVRSFIPAGMFQAPFDLHGPPTSGGTPLSPPGSSTGTGGGGAGADTSGTTLSSGSADAPVVLEGGSLAFVVTNPWIDRDLPGRFQVGFEFAPEEYPGWSANSTYRVARFDVLGNFVVESPATSGHYQVNGHDLAPGDIVWWLFQQLGQSGN